MQVRDLQLCNSFVFALLCRKLHALAMSLRAPACAAGGEMGSRLASALVLCFVLAARAQDSTVLVTNGTQFVEGLAAYGISGVSTELVLGANIIHVD